MFRAIKSFTKDASCLINLFTRRAGVTVLMYHSVGKNNVFFTVLPAAFERQMQYLKDHNYSVISLASLVDMLHSKAVLPPKTIVLTFDDGYRDNYESVWPVLKKHQFPTTIFLVTRAIGKELENSQNSVLPLMNWSQIREMHNEGLIDFEPHGLTHCKLNHCDLDRAQTEIHDSRRMIQEVLNKKCTLISYPKGGYNQGVIELVKKEGLKGAVTVERGRVLSGDNPFALKRCSVNSTTSFIQFKSYLAS